MDSRTRAISSKNSRVLKADSRPTPTSHRRKRLRNSLTPSAYCKLYAIAKRSVNVIEINVALPVMHRWKRIGSKIAGFSQMVTQLPAYLSNRHASSPRLRALSVFRSGQAASIGLSDNGQRATDNKSKRRGVRSYYFREILCCAVIAVHLLGSQVMAQQAQLSQQEGPYYVGEPILIRVTAKDFEEDPPPQCQPGTLSAGLSVELAGVRPSVSSFTQVINGRVSTRRTVVYAFDFHATATKPGTYRIPPFTVSGGGHKAKTNATDLVIQTIQSDGDMRVVLGLPGGAIYPGQRVPIEIQWWYAGDVKDVRNLVIRSPLFDQFSFVDEAFTRGDTVLPIQTKQGVLQIKANVDRRTLDGRTFIVLSAKRQLIVDKTESVQLAPITASVEKVTRWGRGFFGRREPAATAKLRAVGKPQTLTVRSLPLDQAPASFAGAVGVGFTIAVEADRTVVQVGDPIVLNVTLRGEGNLSEAGPPLLSAAGVLDSTLFRTSQGDVAGEVTEGRKRFSMTVRVLDEGASEIPSIPYTWFDPGRERFETAMSEPIALRVLPGKVVSAGDVVGTVPTQNTDQDVGDGTRPDRDESDSPTRSTRLLNLSGAELAIETDVDRLLVPESNRFGGYRTRAGIYLGSVAVILVGGWRRRAAEIDPERRRRRQGWKRDVRQIHEAGRLPAPEAARQIAEALRRLAPGVHGESRAEIDGILASCDAVAFAPPSTPSQPLDPAIHQRASIAAKAILQEKSSCV